MDVRGNMGRTNKSYYQPSASLHFNGKKLMNKCKWLLPCIEGGGNVSNHHIRLFVNSYTYKMRSELIGGYKSNKNKQNTYKKMTWWRNIQDIIIRVVTIHQWQSSMLMIPGSLPQCWSTFPSKICLAFESPLSLNHLLFLVMMNAFLSRFLWPALVLKKS